MLILLMEHSQRYYFRNGDYMEPGTAMLIASAISAAAKGASEAGAASNDKKAAKRRAKELKRETYGGLVSDVSQRGAELEAQRLQGNRKLGQRRTQSLTDTTDLIRRAFSI